MYSRYSRCCIVDLLINVVAHLPDPKSAVFSVPEYVVDGHVRAGLRLSNSRLVVLVPANELMTMYFGSMSDAACLAGPAPFPPGEPAIEEILSLMVFMS